MDIVVINSFGPMGSTVVSSILEKFGYLNLPVRKLGLSDYLTKQRSNKDSFMVNRFFALIEIQNKEKALGGISVLDRENNIQRNIDKKLIEKELSELKSYNIDSIVELYDHLKSLFVKAMIYKNTNHINGKHIEMLTGRDLQHDPEKLYMSYKAHFERVYFIHLHRKFDSWCNSLVSQWFTRKNGQPFYRFNIDKIYSTFMDYEKFANQIPGLNIDFDDLFLPKTNKLFESISQFINHEMHPDFNIEEEKFDLYGALTPYKKTFTKFDDKQVFLSDRSRIAINKYINHSNSLNKSIIIDLLYLFDLIKYKISQLFSRVPNLKTGLTIN